MARTKMNYRKIWEAHHNACILPGMHVHHIDGDSHNNNPDNLLVCTPQEHWNIHYAQGDIRCLNGKFVQGASEAGRKGGKTGVGWKYNEEQSMCLSKSLKESYIRRGGSSLKDRSITENHKANISNGVQGKKNGMFNKNHTEESKKKISQNRKGIVGREAGWTHTNEAKDKVSEARKKHFANGGTNSTAKLWDIFDETGNLLFTYFTKYDIIKQYDLNETTYKSLLAYMRRNDFKKVHRTLNILIKEAIND
jgi:hypothetical protein